MTVTANSVNRRVELTVSDEGAGIPQRVQGRIFERFYTAESGGGSGLGPGDRPRARAAHAGADLDHLEQALHRLHPRPAAGRAPGRRGRWSPKTEAPGVSARIALLAALLALALLAGCGGSGGGPDVGGSDSTTTVTTTATTEAEPQVVVQWPPSTASTRPRSTTRRPREWSRSARSSSSGAAEGSGFVARHRRQDRHQRPRRHRRPRAASREPAKAVYVEFPDRNVVSGEDRRLRPLRRRRPARGRPGGLDLHPLELGDDNDLVVGQPVAAIGSPFGQQHSLSVGIDLGHRPLGRIADPTSRSRGRSRPTPRSTPATPEGPLLDAEARVVGDQPADRDRIRRQRRGRVRGPDLGRQALARPARRRRQGRIRLHRRLDPVALPAARRRARPRRRLRRPDRRSRPRRPRRQGGPSGRRRQNPLPGPPGTGPAAT